MSYGLVTTLSICSGASPPPQTRILKRPMNGLRKSFAVPFVQSIRATTIAYRLMQRSDQVLVQLGS